MILKQGSHMDECKRAYIPKHLLGCHLLFKINIMIHHQENTCYARQLAKPAKPWLYTSTMCFLDNIYVVLLSMGEFPSLQYTTYPACTN